MDAGLQGLCEKEGHWLTFEEATRILLLEREELPGGLADLGESELDPPDLALVPQSVLSDQFQLL